MNCEGVMSKLVLGYAVLNVYLFFTDPHAEPDITNGAFKYMGNPTEYDQPRRYNEVG